MGRFVARNACRTNSPAIPRLQLQVPATFCCQLQERMPETVAKSTFQGANVVAASCWGRNGPALILFGYFTR